MSKELKNVEKQIAHLEKQMSDKGHGGATFDNRELKVTQKLADLYKKRATLKNKLEIKKD